MLRKLLLTTPLVAAALAAPSADAATTVGQIAGPGLTGSPCGSCVYFAPAPADAIPTDGVVTSFTTRMGSFLPAGNNAQLVVLRPTTGGKFATVAYSGGAALNFKFTAGKTRIGVRAGDVIGIKLNTPGGNTAAQHFSSGGTVAVTNGIPSSGQEIAEGNGPYQYTKTTGYRPNVSAVVEPDADKDGFGDETQDACPQIATADGACPPPPAPPAPPVLPVAQTPAPPVVTVPVVPRSLPGVPSRRDTAGPRLRVSGRRTLRVTSDERATLVVTARGKTRRFTVVPGRATRVAVKVRRGAKVRVTLAATDGAGNRSVVRRTVR